MAPKDWRHLIDDVWTTDKHKRKTAAEIKNRGQLGLGGHCSGSRSFVAGMTTPLEDNGYANLEFPEFYEKMNTKKDNTWIDDICGANHVVKDA
ncbi:uncharacterized protein LOC131329278 isoform X2 [Rhododendron vialii]|uniref:uncharacterized protein LOC131329278 isoform X2 n=1 Tax=Rhododendron vialii TaxID=182163 RepID=UPI00265FC057|nr:uncharacterized protein LOC131329278 isoform X2 [Rhododendron vialii]